MNKFLKQLNPKQSIVGLVICMVLLAQMPFIAKELGGTTWVRIIDMALLYVMLALGLNIVVGCRDDWAWVMWRVIRSARIWWHCCHHVI